MSQPALFTIIYGPTASGKTELAYSLAKTQGANILSFDSRHVYKDMSIVTGKDLPHENAPFSVFGMDLVSPNQEFSIRHYYEYAKAIIADHRERHQPLILVGGSWQYAGVLIDPPASLFVERNSKDRAELELLPLETLQTRVQRQNPQRWQSMNESDRANPRRLLRALELEDTPTSVPLPFLNKNEYTLELLNPDMSYLEKKIQQRIESRLDEGALRETQNLREKYPDWSFPSFTSTGYGILRRYLEKQITLQEAKELWYLQERQYVKRQKTWIKKITAEQ